MSAVKTPFSYMGTCIDCDERDIFRMKVFAREISHDTFRVNCSYSNDFAVAMGFAGVSKLARHPHTKFFRSKYCGRKCYFVRVDGVKYIWCEEEAR